MLIYDCGGSQSEERAVPLEGHLPSLEVKRVRGEGDAVRRLDSHSPPLLAGAVE